MQHFRGILTRLKSLMVEKLPDGNDLYGYDGVSKDALLASIDAAHTLSQEITQNDESRFEVISLKRAGSELYKTLKDFFEIDEQSSKKRPRFNDFLNCLSKLVEKTKITYFIVAKNGLRDDEELMSIRTRIAELAALKKEIFEAVDPAQQAIATINTQAAEIAINHTTSAAQSIEIGNWNKQADEHFTELEKIYAKIVGWDEDIKTITTQYQVLLKQIQDLSASAERRRDELRGYAETGKETADMLLVSSEKHQKLLEEIEEILGGANRVGLSAAFITRKDELKKPLEIWQGIFITAIVCIVLAVWFLVIPAIGKGDTIMMAVEIALIAPLVWLGWFAAEQYSYTSKIREDYAFKAAAAMSYEGHKEAARIVNEDLESALLKISLYNMSENPIRLYGDGVHGSPIHKLADSLLTTIFARKFKSANDKPAIQPPLAGSGPAEDD